MEEEKNEIKFSFSKEHVRNSFVTWALGMPAFYILIGSTGFGFGKWYDEMPKEVQQRILMGCGGLIFIAVLHYIFLILFLIKHYKEDDRRQYFYVIALSIVMMAVAIFTWTL